MLPMNANYVTTPHRKYTAEEHPVAALPAREVTTFPGIDDFVRESTEAQAAAGKVQTSWKNLQALKSEMEGKVTYLQAHDNGPEDLNSAPGDVTMRTADLDCLLTQKDGLTRLETQKEGWGSFGTWHEQQEYVTDGSAVCIGEKTFGRHYEERGALYDYQPDGTVAVVDGFEKGR